MNIYLFELKQLKKSILLWGLVVPLSLFSYIAFFPLISSSGDDFMVLMNQMPEEMLAMFGMVPELPITTILGYFSLTFTIVQIPLAIQASNYGFNMLSVEERELTADFLLSRPVTRRKIIISKFLAAFTSLTIVNAILWICSVSAVLIFKSDEPVELNKLFVLLSSVVFFQLFFVGMGMLISMLVKKIQSVISYSMALGFGMYIIASLGTLISSDLFKYLSPYAHFSPSYILINGNYDWILAMISITTIVASLMGSYFLYLRRNIPSL